MAKHVLVTSGSDGAGRGLQEWLNELQPDATVHTSYLTVGGMESTLAAELGLEVFQHGMPEPGRFVTMSPRQLAEELVLRVLAAGVTEHHHFGHAMSSGACHEFRGLLMAAGVRVFVH